MKPYPFLFAGLLIFAQAAGAQVIINHAALDQLAGLPPPVITAPPAIRQAPRKITYRHVIPRRTHILPRLAATVTPKPPLAPAPAPPPVQAVVAKPAPLPPPPKPQILQPAVINFAANDSDLPANVTAALKPFCAHPGLITIDAYAAADPNDPSQAARLSMSRAFAIRDALTACGVPSSNIIPRANGSATAKNPDAAEVSATP